MSDAKTVPRALVLEQFRYPVRGSPQRGTCRLEVIPLPDGRTVAIVTEPPVNTAASVTNAAEELAAEISRQLRLDPHRLVLIEHYGYADGSSGQPRGFDRVTFDAEASTGLTFRNPSWRPMTDADWADLGLPVRAPVRYDAPDKGRMSIDAGVTR